jgi:hypothetical protein
MKDKQVGAYVRDVPRSCLCSWEWVSKRGEWHLLAVHPYCIWHTSNMEYSSEWRPSHA